MTWPELAADMMALPGPCRASCGWEMDPPPTAGLSVCPSRSHWTWQPREAPYIQMNENSAQLEIQLLGHTSSVSRLNSHVWPPY